MVLPCRVVSCRASTQLAANHRLVSAGGPRSPVMGKAEGTGENWHGHVTAITVGPEFRRIGLATSMMSWLERVSEHVYNGYFVDLFVRQSNAVAVGMYKQLGYSVYRQVIGYYSGEEDAYGTCACCCRSAAHNHCCRAAAATFMLIGIMMIGTDMRKALPRDVNKKSIIPLPAPVYPEDVD